MPTEIEALPDYAALKQVQEALWGEGAVRGAAVMVGAGFSRLAQRVSPDAPIPPLWRDLESAMADALSLSDRDVRDPLRLAQEYKAAFGTSALNALIRSLVTDDLWEPGVEHKRLLSLPWTDILTTNWDTLLERTPSSKPERQPDVVRTLDDIANTRSPRIVKLHGSLPSNGPFILTEEDYRTYPRTHAPFVNLAQQVLLESELCLLGFSGDDPNFLQWSGWVRDHLGDRARPIRLVGALNLTSSQRKMLEQRNVTPIDLGPLFVRLPRSEQHTSAVETFLIALRTARPTPRHYWARAERLASSGDEVITISKLTERWREERSAYPGWLLAPFHEQYRLRMDTDQIPQVDAEGAGTAAELEHAYECLWRYDCGGYPVRYPFRRNFQQLINGGGGASLSRQQFDFAASVLAREARLEEDGDDIGHWLGMLEQSESPVAQNHWRFNRAMSALSAPNFAAALSEIQQLDVSEAVWKLRKAMVLASLLCEDEAKQLVKQAFFQLRAMRQKDPKSIWLLSREAWAAYMFSSACRFGEYDALSDYDLEEWPDTYRPDKCDPWDYYRGLDQDLYDDTRRQRDTTASTRFDPGQIRRQGKMLPTSDGVAVRPFDLLLRLRERVGLPPTINRINMSAGRLTEAAIAYGESNDRLRHLSLGWIIDSSRDDVEVFFSRIDVASADEQFCRETISSLRTSVEFVLSGLNEVGQWADIASKARILLEVMSRLVMRLRDDDVVATLRWAFSLAARPALKHWWVFEALGNLLERSLKALPHDQISQFTGDMLNLPLPGEKDTELPERDWPELAGLFQDVPISRPEKGQAWSHRIAQLIERVAGGRAADRTRATMRLFVLQQAGILTPNERVAVSTALWARLDEHTGLPGELNLFHFVSLCFPDAAPDDYTERYAKAVMDPLADGRIDERSTTDLVGFFHCGLSSGALEKISKRRELIAALFEWTIPETSNLPSIADYESQRARDASWQVGRLLGQFLLPRERSGGLPGDFLEDLTASIVEVRHPNCFAGFAQLVRLSPEVPEAARVAFRSALLGRDVDPKQAACFALKQVVDLPKSKLTKVRDWLEPDLVSACELDVGAGVRFALNAAAKWGERGLLGTTSLIRLRNTLLVLHETYDYASWNRKDTRTPFLTLVRAEMLPLCEVILQAGEGGHVLREMRDALLADPVPEVRFALHNR